MMESEIRAIRRIINNEVVFRHFGYWPDFLDSEITKVTFETHPTGRYSVTFVIAAFEITKEKDESGFYNHRHTKHCDVELQLIGIKELKFDSFSSQNVILDLEFGECRGNIECVVNASTGLEFAIVAEEAFVLSLTPTKR
ncbi:immunity 50 family protein [Hymenobacter latericus]|uniref:immunity 50 family protein n=1 Tax=Hymenobacter sp. YIM 151858-1 TaxID=2987688 RepID=UPI002227607D|nr:immunity 50 family protein [Hymenobacter sp. YIM 151858-1]UYZ59868.1 immunity 50 family protein [Hymenobacter sp. YIM 151858-1]